MSANHAVQLPSTPPGSGLSGHWTLTRRHAVTLDARQAGTLQVDRGSVWATLDGPHQGPANDWGDVVLQSGARIHLTPGQHVVLESFTPAANEDSSFVWEPDADATATHGAALSARWKAFASAWKSAFGARLLRWFRATGRWAPMSPDAFTEAKARASQSLRYLTISQP